MEFSTRNVNTAVSDALWKLKVMGVKEQTRNGEVIAFPEPVMTTYENPTERVLFWPDRDANPIFHLMESLWMLAGRDDVEFVAYFNARMRDFSDNGETLNGAYGHRWRHRFGCDQLDVLVKHLRSNPESRRAVLDMWGVRTDLFVVDTSKDVCCNTQAYFEIRGGKLNMTVLNRSNDLIWGAYGANAVHFSILQEVIASAVDVPVGVYRQFSHNLHMYTTLYDFGKFIDMPPEPLSYDAYQIGLVTKRDLMDTPDLTTFLRDCADFCDNPWGRNDFAHSFFEAVAYPMAMLTRTRKEKRGDGLYWAEQIAAGDWNLACQQWIERRENAKKN